MTARTVYPPRPCGRCGRMMRSPAELDSESYTGVCDHCEFREPFVEAVQLLDQVRVWSYPPHRSAGTRLRTLVVGYPDCKRCLGKGIPVSPEESPTVEHKLIGDNGQCYLCLSRNDSHPVRQWIKSREERIAKASQAVYEAALGARGLVELAKRDAVPKKRLKEVVDPILRRVSELRARWHALVVSRLKPVAMGKS